MELIGMDQFHDENEITVPQTFFPLNERDVQELMDTILPSAPC